MQTTTCCRDLISDDCRCSTVRRLRNSHSSLHVNDVLIFFDIDFIEIAKYDFVYVGFRYTLGAYINRSLKQKLINSCHALEPLISINIFRIILFDTKLV